MNTGPIIGGTRDAEQFSFHDTHAYIPAIRMLSPDWTDNHLPHHMIENDREQLRWVPFHFHMRDTDTKFGFWVSLGYETRNMVEDAEFRVYIIMKLSERYKRRANDPRPEH